MTVFSCIMWWKSCNINFLHLLCFYWYFDGFEFKNEVRNLLFSLFTTFNKYAVRRVSLTESVSAIWAMCFDEDNRKRVANDKELGVVELLHDLQKSENPQIKKACDGALFTLWDSLKASSVTFYKSISMFVFTFASFFSSLSSFFAGTI